MPVCAEIMRMSLAFSFSAQHDFQFKCFSFRGFDFVGRR